MPVSVSIVGSFAVNEKEYKSGTLGLERRESPLTLGKYIYIYHII